MEARFSPRVKDVLTYSREEAIRLGHDYIGTEHLILGMIRAGEGVGIKILNTLGVDVNDLRKELEATIRPHSKNTVNMANIPIVKQAEKALKVTYLEAKLFNSSIIGTEHLLLAILKDEESVVTRILKRYKVDYNVVKDEISYMMGEGPKSEFPGNPNEDDPEESNMGFSSGKKQGESKSKTPVLDNFGRDLSKMAEEGKLDPIIGRDKEIERVSQILSRRKKNNPILIGEPGVGKSAIAEGLALRIAQKKVSRVLFGKRIVSLDL